MPPRTAPVNGSRRTKATIPPDMIVDPTPQKAAPEVEAEDEGEGVQIVRRVMPATAVLTFQSYPGSPYSPSRYVADQSRQGEDKDSYDNRIKDQKAHYAGDDAENFKPSPDDIVVLPTMGVRKALEQAAKIGGYKVPGRMRMQWNTVFRSGILVLGPIHICDPDGNPIRRKDLGYVKLHLDAQGVSGGGSRVHRRFPIIKEWQATVRIKIMNPAIHKEIMEVIAMDAGAVVGFGRHRMEVGGNNGLFQLSNIDWQK